MKSVYKLILALSCFYALSASINGDLVKAAADGNQNEVERLLAQGANADAYNGPGFSALSQAAEYGHFEIVVNLLNHGASQWIPDALSSAAERGHLTIVQLLVKYNIFLKYDPSSRNSILHRALISAAYGEHLEIIQFLLSFGIHDYANGPWGESALEAAASKGNLAITQLLLDHNNTSEYANAATRAAGNGHLAVVKLLCSRGAHISDWALICAAGRGDLTMTNFLLDYGIDIHAAGPAGPDSALKEAIRNEHFAVIKFLLNHGAYTHRALEFALELEFASEKDHRTSISLLTKFENFRKSPFTFKERNTDTHPNQLVLWAVALHRPDVLDILLTKYPAAANAAYVTEETGIITALMFAAIFGFEDMVSQLLHADANINVQNKEHKNAMKLAADYGQFRVAAQLLMWQKGVNLF